MEEKKAEKRTVVIPLSPRAQQVIEPKLEEVCSEDLVVHEGDSVTLSTKIEQFKPHYKTVYPKTIDEVKEEIGVPKDVPFSRPLCCDSPLKTAIPSAEELADPERAMKATKMVRLAAREYVKGDYKNVEQWVGIINSWLVKAVAETHLGTFRNIVVEDGGVLRVSRDTHALYANSIELYGTGRIEAEGDLTIDCVSFEGNKSVVAGARVVGVVRGVKR